MGNSNKGTSSLQVLRQNQPGEWLPLTTLAHCELVKHGQRGFQAEQYSVPRDVSLSEQEELQRYQFRCVQESNLVRVYQTERLNGGPQASGYRVRTERIVARLAELKDLGLEQGLFILKEALVGYRTVVQLRGPAVVTDRMIGVNQQGRVKVWINENFGRSSPEEKDKLKISEATMVDNIYQLVGKRLKNGSFPSVFQQTYDQATDRNCSTVIQLITQFIAGNNLHMPDRLNLTPLSQPKPPSRVPTNNNMPAGMQIVSQPVLPLQGSHVVEQIFRQPSSTRIGIHQEFQQQRTVVTPRLSAVQVRNSNPTNPSPQPFLRPSAQVVTTTTETVVPPHLVRNVVTPVPTRKPLQNSVLFSERAIVSPRPVVSRSPVREVIEILNSPVTVSTIIEPAAVMVSHPVLPRVSSSQSLIPVNPPSYPYPRNRFIDMTNAKVTAYAESEVIGFRTTENKPHVTYVPADPEFREGVGLVEKRDTIALPTQRAKSEYISSIMSKPMTPTPHKRRGRRTLHESRNRELRGQPILHEDYDEFMGRMKRGQRPKSQFIRASVAGVRGSTVIEKRPAVFAAEKIVTGETTVERSPKKKYVSADPISLSITKNEMNKKSKKLIKFPIKKQVMVKGYERQSFESDLDPIIKQTQSSREIKLINEPRVIRDHSPEETPWKGMDSSAVLEVRRSAVVNPEVAHFGLPHNKSPKLSTSKVQFNIQNQANQVVQTRISPPPLKVETVVHEVHQVPVIHHVQATHHVPVVQQIQQVQIQQIQVQQVQQIQTIQQQVRQVQHIIRQPEHLHREQQEQTMLRYSPPKKDAQPHIDIQHPIPAPAQHLPYHSSEDILRIIEESKRYRANASANLEDVLKSNYTEKRYNHIEQPKFAFNYANNSNIAAPAPSYDYRPSVPVVMRSNIEEDISTLRPETLFEPKPPSKREQIYQTFETSEYIYSQPLPQGFTRPAEIAGDYTKTYTSTVNAYNEHNNDQLFHSFGNTKPQIQNYEQVQYEQEVISYRNSSQEVNYYRRDYEQVEYGNSSSLTANVGAPFDQAAGFSKALETNEPRFIPYGTTSNEILLKGLLPARQ